MKRIINKQEEPTISLSDVQYITHPIIGAQHTNSKQKALVVMTEFEKSNAYKLVCVEGFERGNHYDSRAYSGTLENIFKLPVHEFFLFETPQELFAWLAK